MKQGINLTLGRKRVDYALRKISIVAIGFFFVTVVASLSLIAYRLVLRGTFNSLEAEERLLNSQLLANQEKRDKYIETKTRLVDVKNILAKRSPITVRLDTLEQVVPPASEVTSITGSNEELQITIESEDLLSLNELVEQKIQQVSEERQKGIKKVDMKSFGLDPKTLRYYMTLGISFI